MTEYEKYLDESLSKLKTIMDETGSRPILFIGTGLSRRYLGAPDWKGLLEILVNKNPIINYPLGYYMQQANNLLPNVASLLINDYHKYAWEEYENNIFPKCLWQNKNRAVRKLKNRA